MYCQCVNTRNFNFVQMYKILVLLLYIITNCMKP
nr:MAG TPA: hypothetical protein [Caudoviricetes sp.]